MDWLREFDLSAFRAINVGLHRSWLDPVFLVLSYLGLGQVQALLSLLFCLHKSTRRFVVPLLITIVIAGLPVVQGMKSVIPRDRPSNLPFAIVQENLYHGSFPSGHTTTSFAVAAMLVFLCWNTRYLRLAQSSLLVAALIGISRMYRGVHWPTDVIGGACFGVATACVLYLVLPRLGMPIGEGDRRQETGGRQAEGRTRR